MRSPRKGLMTVTVVSAGHICCKSTFIHHRACLTFYSPEDKIPLSAQINVNHGSTHFLPLSHLTLLVHLQNQCNCPQKRLRLHKNQPYLQLVQNQRGASQVSDPISPEPSSGHLHSQKTSHSLLSLSSNQCQFWTKLETLRSYTITFFQVSVPIYLSSEPSWSHFHKLHYQKNWILSSLSSV